MKTYEEQSEKIEELYERIRVLESNLYWMVTFERIDNRYNRLGAQTDVLDQHPAEWLVSENTYRIKIGSPDTVILMAIPISERQYKDLNK